MSETKHTPGPWVTDERHNYPCDIYANSENGEELIAIACDLDDGGAMTDEANARFIVRACNSHEELLAALKRLTAEIAGMIDIEEPELRRLLGNTNFACIQQRFLEAREAIAKAEGQ